MEIDIIIVDNDNEYIIEENTGEIINTIIANKINEYIDKNKGEERNGYNE